MHAGHRNRTLTGLAVILQGTSFSFFAGGDAGIAVDAAVGITKNFMHVMALSSYAALI
jgi:hypothetical protein